MSFTTASFLRNLVFRRGHQLKTQPKHSPFLPFLRSFPETRPTTVCDVGKLAVVTRYSLLHGNEGNRTRFIGSATASRPPVHKIGWCGKYRANASAKSLAR